MPLDASIIGRGFQTKSPFQQYAELAQVQGAMNQNKLADLQLQQAEAGAQKQSRLQQLLQQEFADPAAREGALLKQGFVDESLKLGKDRREGAKLENESLRAKSAAEKDALETAAKKIAMTTQVLSAAKDPQSYMQGRQFLRANGIDVSGSPEQFDPAWVANSLQQGQSIQERLAQVWKQKGYDLDVSKFDEAKRSNRVSEGISAGNLGVARANLGLRQQEIGQALSKPFEVTGPEGTPILVQQDKQGNIKPVQGYAPKGGAEKPLTEGQAKAVAFASRMQAADKIVGNLAAKGTTTSIPGSRAGYGVGGVVNAISPAANQQLDQAKRDFINAVLRRESGAVISESEFSNAEKQYFPQIGDSAEVKRQKADNRHISLEGMKADVPTGRRGQIDTIASGDKTSPTPANLQQLLDKYK